MREIDNGRMLLEQNEINFVRKEAGFLFLPVASKDGAIVELIIMDQWSYIVDGGGLHIRYGKFIGSKVILGGGYESIDYNPKFVFDGVKMEWRLICTGYVLFPEIEVNAPQRGENRE